MKYIVPEKRMMNLVEKMVAHVFPNFNRENSLKMTWSDGDHSYKEFYDPNIPGHKGLFAKYFIWERELQLNTELFKKLESFFGDEKMTFVLDWFNDEFDEEAETVTF